MNDIEKEVLQRLLGDALTELRVLGSYVDHPDTCWPNLGLKVTATAQKKLAQRIEKVLAGKAPEKVPCGECGLPLTEVRPGKHQCDNCEASKVIEELKKDRDLLLEEVKLLQAEVRKQVFGSRVVFDREVVERAQLASDDPLEWPEPKR